MRVPLLAPGEAEAALLDEDHKTCQVCTRNRPPDRAYRPHALDEDCWCTRYEDGRRVTSMCWVFTAYLAE